MTVITKCDRKFLSMVGITKCDKRLSLSVTAITKCDKRLSLSVTALTKCDWYYKVRRLLQNDA